MTDGHSAIEDLPAFRRRAREWIEEHLEPRTEDVAEVLDLDEDCALQAKLFNAGFSGFVVPQVYGGVGLTLEHQTAFFDEAADFVTPTGFGVSIGMLAPTILDHGSEHLKRRYLPAILRGDARFIQLLSEPSGGSDMAAVITRATRDGDVFVVNGAKMWSTGARAATHGLLLARSDWDVPKHRGLTMFVVSLAATGITIEDIALADGSVRFCQEFLDEVVIPVDDVIGSENEGWAVAQSLLVHERRATVGTGLGYGYMKRGVVVGDLASSMGDLASSLLEVARRRGAHDDPATRQLIGRVCVETIAQDFARRRIMAGQASGELTGQWGSLLKLGRGTNAPLLAELGLAIAGARGVIATGDVATDFEQGTEWIVSRGPAIGGGTNEMQRNIVSERLLGLPREHDPSRDVPFREIQKRRSGDLG